MTAKEAWRAFIYKHQKEMIDAQYAVESEVDQSILLMQANRFKHVLRQDTGEETETHTNFSDVSEYTYYVEPPEEVTEITKEHQLLIVGGKTRIQITVSPYDKFKMDQRWTLGTEETEVVEEEVDEEIELTVEEA